ncbi:hypothetical protein BJX61DRAFT_221358 [Aspergillus egyptiacus]|nr:hypothetical protein BJX61DRAFT_221358 [Aspergillus egyptiacus]
MNTLKRLSLGQSAAIGTLYDARDEAFLNESLLLGTLPPDAIASTPIDRAETTVVNGRSIKEKFDRMDVSPELGASLLAGQVAPRGSARYLTQQGESAPAVERAVVYTVATRMEQLSFMAGNIRDVLNFDALASSSATHVVTGITWGARAVVSGCRRITAEVDEGECEQMLDKAFGSFSDSTATDLDARLEAPGETSKVQEEVRVRLYTDAREILDGHADNLSDTREHFHQLRPYVEHTGGKPLVYTLLPVAFLVTLGAVIPKDVTPGQLSPECYDRLVRVVDQLGQVQQRLNTHRQKLLQHRSLVADTHFAEVEEHLTKAIAAEAKLRHDYADALSAVRQDTSTSQTVMEILTRVADDIISEQALETMTSRYEYKLDFMVKMTQLGAQRVGSDVRFALKSAASEVHTFYLFHLSINVADPSDPVWVENVRLLEDLLSQQPRPRVLLADWADPDFPSEPYIAVYTDGRIVVENLLAQKKELAEKHLVRYDRSYLETTNDVPTYRKSLRIPCPAPACEEQDLCLWSCYDCHETVEFGSRDGYFYCDCGRVPFDKAEFNCQRPRHKAGYFQFERDDLRELLRSLPAPREVNILILGESGVGKSTFVNAFVNYLTFSSLDEGLRDPKLNCIIPCSFTTQVVDEDGRMISRDVVVGRDKDEMDGSRGHSATQKATVYPLYFRDTLIRLIDTPGIGDTRGIEQDKQNMANMLSILRNYPSLHGILILLKPNNARLGVMFRFCVKELLTHLHTSAAQNMVFGFTNTRGSNYTPGDTFKPLESLLSSYRHVIPQLSRSNVYCFDSESFRYLAARKQGIEMGHIDDYRRSWEYSAQEADRLLAHFQALRPHHTQETLSLNETRHLIAQLTAPMQQISVAITDTIARNEQQAKDLQTVELTMDELKTKLRIHKTTVSAAQLAKPKTVCANEKCVESVFDEERGAEVLLRKKLCHNPCCLTNVPVGKVGTPQLKNCWAFAGDNCTICKHSWQEHEHILVEYSKKQETVLDDKVQRELATTGSMAQAKRNAIQALEKNIQELKEEHAQVQAAAARFSLYLKHNSITHYNDATVEYLEHLIKDERTKVRTGQSRARLESLEKDLENYKRFVEAMEQRDKVGGTGKSHNGEMYVPLNEAGVATLVQKLYNLPHYGQMLKDLAQVVANAYEANFRERPYRISRRKYWRSGQSASESASSQLFGRKRSVRFPSALGTAGRYYTSSSVPGNFDGSPVRLNEKPMPPQSDSGRGGESNDFWPSEKQPSSLGRPVRSIMDWGVANEAGPSTGNSWSFNHSSLASAPPPYPGPGDSSAGGDQLPGVPVDEKKGIWVRLKGKLRKR